MLDSLKLEIVKDLNTPKIAGPFVGFIDTCSRHPKNYQKLLDLIENHVFYNYLEDYDKKITISDLNEMDLNLFEKISNIDNVKITRTPMFIRHYIKDHEIFSKTEAVSEYLLTEPILNYLQRKKNISFYIYQLSEFSGRICKYETSEQEFKRIRREKLEKLEKLQLI